MRSEFSRPEFSSTRTIYGAHVGVEKKYVYFNESIYNIILIAYYIIHSTTVLL